MPRYATLSAGHRLWQPTVSQISDLYRSSLGSFQFKCAGQTYQEVLLRTGDIKLTRLMFLLSFLSLTPFCFLYDFLIAYEG